MAGERYAMLEYETSAQGSESNPSPTLLATPKFFLPSIEVGMAPKPAPLDRSNELRNIDGNVTLAQNEYNPDGNFNLRAYTSYMGALLMLLFGDVTTTPGGVGVTDPDAGNPPATTFKHVFKKKPGALPLTARLTLGYATKWIRCHGTSVNSIGFTLDDDGVKADGSLMSNYVQRLTVDPAAVVTQDAFSILPFRRRNVQLTVSDGGTVNVDSVGFTMEQALEYARTMGSRSGWPTATERANSSDGFLRLSGTFKRRDFDSADWDALIAATTFSLKVAMKSEQNILATSYPYSMWVEAPKSQFTDGGPESLKQQARHESDYDWRAGSDTSGTDDFTVTIVNDVAAYK